MGPLQGRRDWKENASTKDAPIIGGGGGVSVGNSRKEEEETECSGIKSKETFRAGESEEEETRRLCMDTGSRTCGSDGTGSDRAGTERTKGSTEIGTSRETEATRMEAIGTDNEGTGEGSYKPTIARMD
jgi:hypothetical protein